MKSSSKHTLGLALILILAPIGASAQRPQLSVNTDPGRVTAGAYRLDPAHTRVLFSVSHLGFSTFYGEFPRPTGTARLNPVSSADDAVDVSASVAGVSTGNTTLDAELRGEKWLDAEKYPTIRFKSVKVTQTGPGQADVAGELTLHGVTRPVTLQARFIGSGVNPLSKTYTAGLQVSGEIKRSDFGVDTYLPMIGDDVGLIISVALEQTPT